MGAGEEYNLLGTEELLMIDSMIDALDDLEGAYCDLRESILEILIERIFLRYYPLSLFLICVYIGGLGLAAILPYMLKW